MNTLLGKVEEDAEVLRSAIAYLSVHAEGPFRRVVIG